MTSRLAGETITASNYNADIDAGPMGIIGRAQRTTSSSTSTGSVVGVLRIDDVPLKASRAYRIQSTPLNIDATVATSDVRVSIRFTADGSTPTTASTVLPGTIVGANTSSGGTAAPTFTISTYYAPAGGDELFSGLLCVQRLAGAGNAYIFGDATQKIEFWIEDIGLAVVDSGTDI